MNKVLSQIYTYIPAEVITVRNDAENESISINMVRFARTLVNLIDNAWHFIEPPDGKINIHLSQMDGNIIIKIKDNGCGISKENLQHIWEHGYSARHSTGFGLSYVKQTIDNHNGDIQIQSKENEFTLVTITLKKEVPNEHS